MNVVKVGDVYKATRITGPQHNFLGLVLSETGVESVTIEPLSVDASEGAVESLVFNSRSRSRFTSSFHRSRSAWRHGSRSWRHAGRSLATPTIASCSTCGSVVSFQTIINPLLHNLCH